MIDRVHTLDLHFQDRPETIAAYLLPHADGTALVETGPASTAPMLQRRLSEHGFTPNDITEVLLTHIHLDHAGAAGWLAAEHDATVYVHPKGAPHMVNPEHLLHSAERIYGDDMDRLWGEVRPVPEQQLEILGDEETIDLGDLRVFALDTPGHASHHLTYVIGEVCFTGDMGGVRMPGKTYVELPLPPPEIRLDHWRESLTRLRAAVHQYDVSHLAPTHFGLYSDVSAHLDRLEAVIEAADRWTEQTLPDFLDAGDDVLRNATTSWMRAQAAANGVDDETWELYELANPSWMAALGLRRYWKKYKAPSDV